MSMLSTIYHEHITMKEELLWHTKAAVAAVVSNGVVWGLTEVNQIVSIGLGVVTVVFVVAQLLFLLRKWSKLEKQDWNGSVPKE